MALHWYRRPRIVVLKPSNSILDAARALERTEAFSAPAQPAAG